jgi:hypothetical protein
LWDEKKNNEACGWRMEKIKNKIETREGMSDI